MYPIHLNLAGKQCVIIGGGPVAERRIGPLLAEHAQIVFVAPEATEGLQALAAQGRVTWQQETYRREHLDTAFLVIAATNHRETNAQIVRDAEAKSLLVCCADQSEDGNFIVPAQIVRGDLHLTVTTGGKSPTLTAVVRERLEQEFDVVWGPMTELIGTLRGQIKALPGGEAARKAAVRQMLNDPEILTLLQNGAQQEAQARAEECLSSYLE